VNLAERAQARYKAGTVASVVRAVTCVRVESANP
jgi:hypothetical protein